jgi:hypothetical protein
MSKFDACANSYRLSNTQDATKLRPSAITLPNILEFAMNRTLKIAIATAASLAFASGAQAASSKMLDKMMDTCIKQFVASNFADYQGKLTVQKLDNDTYGPALIAGNGSYQISVAAVGRPGSTQIATATCQMARDGSVIAIKSVPLATIKKAPSGDAMTVAKNELE